MLEHTGLKIGDGLLQFFAGIHDKGALLDHRLAQRKGCEQQDAGT